MQRRQALRFDVLLESHSWLISTTHERHVFFQTFRQSCRSELLPGRGVLISQAGPLLIQRQLILSAAVRRVCLDVWFPHALFPSTRPTATLSRRSNCLHRKMSRKVPINPALPLKEKPLPPPAMPEAKLGLRLFPNLGGTVKCHKRYVTVHSPLAHGSEIEADFGFSCFHFFLWLGGLDVEFSYDLSLGKPPALATSIRIGVM